MVKKLSILFIIIFTVFMFNGCNSSQTSQPDSATVIRFAELMDENGQVSEKIKSLGGKNVAMTGFMAAQSPLDGSFAYMVSMPFISCPYCVPGSNTLLNTIPFMAGKLKKIEYTDNPILVKGILEIEDKVDEFGYSSPYRIIGTSIEELDMSTLPQNVKDYMMLANEGLADQIPSMIYDFYDMLYKFYQTEDEDVFKPVELEKITQLSNKVKSYKIEIFKPLEEMLDEYHEIVKLYNESEIMSKQDPVFNELGARTSEVIKGYNEWSMSVSSIEYK